MTTWQLTSVTAVADITPTARTLRLALPEHIHAMPGQHIDIRLTAEDGYSTARAYSLSDVRETRSVEVTVERLEDGEVSPYLVDVVEVGDPLEISGPHGRWFTWPAGDDRPVQLIGGGSGVAPLMSMIRSREVEAPHTPFSLVYSVRSPENVYYRDEIRQLIEHRRMDVHLIHTRVAPVGSVRPAGRVTAAELAALTIDPDRSPTVFICGPNHFVEHCAKSMIDAGHDPTRIRTERFGE
ncbi:ferredoxin reductase [Gordonia sp. zg691]|uniref:ferredoxin reductase n=1 Tax=Gordonia jinghuaiqii TaxID=2758710 RepID=UPI00166271F9|nr:ferredoxin reductase [Gordonia jinghuaiqii]MBD0862526.1 ferredoxin reductase [Gordonia jinghuaiqii]